MEKKKLKIMYLTGIFPKVSEAFIVNQITGLIDEGFDVDILSLRTPVENITHPDVEKYDLIKRTKYIKIPRNKLLKVMLAFFLFLGNVFKYPGEIKECFNFRRYGITVFTLNPLFISLFFLKQKKKYDILHWNFRTKRYLRCLPQANRRE
tara:strand:+ start:4044 stop:4493 length:450 start_codon:yes stop_codon:yes gene_type:complete